jgi:hypothetical protein
MVKVWIIETNLKTTFIPRNIVHRSYNNKLLFLIVSARRWVPQWEALRGRQILLMMIWMSWMMILLVFNLYMFEVFHQYKSIIVQ